MRKVYRRRRLAALAVLTVLFLAVLALFGALGTQASSQVQGDQLGPDGESRAEYIARVAGSDIPNEPAYALVTFDEDLPPVAAAAAVAAPINAAAPASPDDAEPSAEIAALRDRQAATLEAMQMRLAEAHERLASAGEQAARLAAAAILVTIPIIIFVLIFQRRIVAGLTSGAVKG